MNSAIYICISLFVFFFSVVFTYKIQKKISPDSLVVDSKGIFKHEKATGIICIVGGVLLMGLFVFIGFKDSEATLNGLLAGFCFGVFFSLVGIWLLLFNFKSFFYIDNEHIKGKYHYFGRIDCNIHDVSFALGRNGTLIIQLKNGKTHTITEIENAWQLASILRKNILIDVSQEPDILIEELNNLKSSRKKEIVYLCSGLVLMFVNIFITVFLIGEKEMYEFSGFDWTIFAIMGVVEIATVVTTFYFANKTGKKNVPIEKLEYYIPRTIVETKPLLPGNMLKVYTDENYTGRITLFGFPNKAYVYYSVEEFDGDYNLDEVFTSEIYEGVEEIEDMVNSLIDITKNFLQ